MAHYYPRGEELLDLEQRIHRLEQNEEFFMSQIDDLNTALAAEDADLQALTTSNATILAELQAAQAATPAVDLTAVIAKVQAQDTALKALTAAQVADEPAPVAVAAPTGPADPASGSTPTAS